MNERNLLSWLALCGAIMVGAACAPPQQNAAEAKAAIAAASENITALVAKGDAAGIAKLYAADALVMPANMDTVTGSANIARLFQDAMDAGMRGVKFEATSVEVAGDLAVETGNYLITGANGLSMDHGKYVMTWKREGGTWKIHRDIWTTSMPPPRGGQAPGAEATPAG
jgi:uncharacterized protein (TIGR02246 family)